MFPYLGHGQGGLEGYLGSGGPAFLRLLLPYPVGGKERKRKLIVIPY